MESDASGTDSTLAGMAGVMAGMIRTRLELLRGDLSDEGETLRAQLRLAAFGTTAALLAGVAAILTIAFGVPAPYRPPALGLLALLLGGLSYWAFSLRKQNRPRLSRPFLTLLDELAKDCAALQPDRRKRHRSDNADAAP